MKTQIDAMKTYVEMFKVDEFKKYAEFAASNAENAAFNRIMQEIPSMIERIIEEERNNITSS